MWLLGLTMLWAEERQELVYTISQNGREIGQSNVVITYFPPSKSIPTAYKKVEIKFSTISLILTLTIYSF